MVSQVKSSKPFTDRSNIEPISLSSRWTWHWKKAPVRTYLLNDQHTDLPPLKWSSLKYDFRTEDKINGEEEAYG